MTLIVADVFDNDQIALVSDTLVTWDPGVHVETPGTEELAKLVILRDELAVGAAGSDPHGRIRDVIAMRDASVQDIVSMLEEDTGADSLSRAWTRLVFGRLNPGEPLKSRPAATPASAKKWPTTMNTSLLSSDNF